MWSRRRRQPPTPRRESRTRSFPLHPQGEPSHQKLHHGFPGSRTLESKSLLSRWPNCGTLGSLGNSHSLRCSIGNGCFWLQCLEASKLYYLCLCENVLWNLGDGQTDVFSVFCAVLIYKKNGPWPLISLKTIHKVLEVILG